MTCVCTLSSATLTSLITLSQLRIFVRLARWPNDHPSVACPKGSRPQVSSSLAQRKVAAYLYRVTRCILLCLCSLSALRRCRGRLPDVWRTHSCKHLHQCSPETLSQQRTGAMLARHAVRGGEGLHESSRHLCSGPEGAAIQRTGNEASGMECQVDCPALFVSTLAATPSQPPVGLHKS